MLSVAAVNDFLRQLSSLFIRESLIGQSDLLYHQSELVGDVAVPVSVCQAVLF